MRKLIGFVGFWGYAIVHGILGWVYIAVKCCMVYL